LIRGIVGLTKKCPPPIKRRIADEVMTALTKEPKASPSVGIAFVSRNKLYRTWIMQLIKYCGVVRAKNIDREFAQFGRHLIKCVLHIQHTE
jgi:hypothetical protein